MKVEKYNKKIIIYIYDEKYKNKNIKEIIRIIFENLEKYYNYKINNSYNLKLYINKEYGMILEIIENKSSYCDNQIVDIKLKVLNDALFLYEVNDPLDFINEEIYYYDNKYYINFKKQKINILENSNLIYGKEVYKILGSGIKI